MMPAMDRDADSQQAAFTPTVFKDRIYVLGTFHPQVNVLTQQVRAFMAVESMERSAREDPAVTRSVVIVGGGFGGLTAAAAAAHLGWSVTVLERASELLPLQARCHTRWVYPYIREWPHENGTGAMRAELPLLGWQAGTANNIAEQILTGFRDAQTRSMHLAVRDGVTGVVVSLENGTPLVRYRRRENAGERTRAKSGWDAGTCSSRPALGLSRRSKVFRCFLIGAMTRLRRPCSSTSRGAAYDRY
jgi:hypothetical protein